MYLPVIDMFYINLCLFLLIKLINVSHLLLKDTAGTKLSALMSAGLHKITILVAQQQLTLHMKSSFQ